MTGGPPPKHRRNSVVIDAGSGASTDASPWGPGTQFASYEIESRLAAGGMAEVWRAKTKGFGGFEKRIVIKTMLTEHRHRSDLVEMFIAEAALAARLSHPNIVDVIDFGQLDGRYYIAMEYVPGLTLKVAHRQLVARGERLPIVALLHVARDVCEALQHIHDLEDGSGELGLVHRDLSPDNIIVSTSGATKLIDFGAARATARTPPGRAFVGKYRYAAPERIRQEGEDRRSDVYSVGVILYECLVGRRPFEGTDAEVIKAIVTSLATDPRAIDSSIPIRVAEVVVKATAQSARDRFASARDLGVALARCLSDLGAASKEREVTSALSRILDAPAPEVSASGRPTALGDAVPEPVANTASETSKREIALSEAEIIEASGPIGLAADGTPEPLTDPDTIRVSLAVPPEARRGARPFQPVSAELNRTPTVSIFRRRDEGAVGAPANLVDAIRGAAASSGGPPNIVGWRATTESPSGERTPADERAVQLFDRGLELRLAGRYGEALDAWERALAFAPMNHLYQFHVRRLREQLDELRAQQRGEHEEDDTKPR